MVLRLRQPLLAVVAVAVLMSFSGCLGNLSPEAEANLIDTLTAPEEPEATEETAPAAPAPAPAAPQPEEETPAATAAATVVVGGAPSNVPLPAAPYVPYAPLDMVKTNLLTGAGPPPANPLPSLEASAVQKVEDVGGGVTLPSGTLVDVFKAWPISFQGAEYASGCLGDGMDCAFFQIPEAAQGQTFTMSFEALVPAGAYFIDLWKGGDYYATYGDPTAAFGAIASDPIPGYGPEGHAVYTNVVPAGVTEFQVYATGGADFVAHLVIGETTCHTDPYAIGSATAGVWVTPLDSLEAPGAMWVYPETNGEPGLQRSDDTFGTSCANGDEWII